MGRFINADGYVSTGQGILGSNMFAYCENNPVNYRDSTGHFLETLFTFINDVVYEAAKAMNQLVPAYATCAGAAVADEPLPFGDFIGTIASAMRI